MLFSIIIPTLNEEHYLPLLLSDIAAQNLPRLGNGAKNFEVIVADGMSKDKTREVAQSFSSHFPLTFLEIKKKNVSFQRNCGAAQATGKYLVFLDADSRIPKDFLSQLKLGFSKKGARLLLPTLLPDDSSQKTKILISIVNSFIKASQSYGKPLATGGNFAVTKECFEMIGGFREDLFISEDHDFVRRAYKKGCKAKILKHAKMITSMRRGKVEGDMTLVYKYIIAFLMYTMTPSTTLKTKIFNYEMGGQRYQLDALKKKRRYADTIRQLRQFLQLGAFIGMIRFFRL